MSPTWQHLHGSAYLKDRVGLHAAEQDHGHDGEDGDDDADADKDGGRPERRRENGGKVVETKPP